MQTFVFRSGNSLAVRLPKHVVEAIRLSEGASVNLYVEDETVCIRPARKKFKLSELLASHHPHDESKSETDWGEPVGKEEW